MSSFSTGVLEILDRRQSDIASAKRSMLLGHTNKQKETLKKSCVLLIYAALEGGIKEMCGYYLSTISRTTPKISDLSSPYLYLATASACKLSDPIVDIRKKFKIVYDIREKMLGNATITGITGIESNLSPKVFMNVCESLGFRSSLDNAEEAKLNQLLRFRNNIAHGDQAMQIDHIRIDSFSAISQTILTEFAYQLCAAYDEKIWMAK